MTITFEHENLNKVCDIYYSPKSSEEVRAYFVVDYLKSGNLKNKIPTWRSNKNLKKEKMVHYMIQLVDALSYIHSKDIIHKCLKPSNILFDENDQNVLISDVLLSKCFDDESIINFNHTNIYIAPEVVNEKKFSQKSDVFSLGCIFFEFF
jgi:serine/threonine protein kinase